MIFRLISAEKLKKIFHSKNTFKINHSTNYYKTDYKMLLVQQFLMQLKLTTKLQNILYFETT